MKKLILAAFILQTTYCVLPPGYEEELYCPSEMCLKNKAMLPGWCGPKSSFHECCNESNGSTTHPHSWGVKVPEEVKTSLIGGGWHTSECVTLVGVCGSSGRQFYKRSKLNAIADVLVHRMDGLLNALYR